MKMNYPCTFTKKIDDDGYVFWRGEQKQLDILVDEYSFTECVAELERTMKKVFRKMTGSDALDNVIRCQHSAVRSSVTFKVPVNRTLTEFMPAAAGCETDEEDQSDLPDVNEVNMAALVTIITTAEIPEDWIPKNGDAVIYRKPAFAEECGVFVINDEDDPEDWDGEVLIAPIGNDDITLVGNDEHTVLESLENLAPCRIGPKQMNLCKEFREYHIEKFLASIPSNDGNGGIADEL